MNDIKENIYVFKTSAIVCHTVQYVHVWYILLYACPSLWWPQCFWPLELIGHVIGILILDFLEVFFFECGVDKTLELMYAILRGAC